MTERIEKLGLDSNPFSVRAVAMPGCSPGRRSLGRCHACPGRHPGPPPTPPPEGGFHMKRIGLLQLNKETLRTLTDEPVRRVGANADGYGSWFTTGCESRIQHCISPNPTG
jgi:hypothetical protein